MNYFLLLLGILIHFGFKIEKARKKHKGFNFLTWVKNNAFYIGTTLLCGLSIILIVEIPDERIIKISGIEINKMRFLCLGAGYLNASLFKNLLAVYKNLLSVLKSKKK